MIAHEIEEEPSGEKFSLGNRGKLHRTQRMHNHQSLTRMCRQRSLAVAHRHGLAIATR